MFRVVITDIAAAEVQENRNTGRQDAALPDALTNAGLVRIASLGDTGLEFFSDPVAGSAIDTLDDGEAATIAYAAETRIAPVLDERKALRIHALRFPGPKALTTMDLFAALPVVAARGLAGISAAVFQTLQTARMRVTPKRVAWIVVLIGAGRAAQCPSLPKATRDG
jgi:predicted nucleic acid-binding protein